MIAVTRADDQRDGVTAKDTDVLKRSHGHNSPTLADAAGEVVYIGVAGGRSPFGLKGALADVLQAPPAGATLFRYEVNMAYHTRHVELLQAYHYDHGCLPVGNIDIDATSLGRLRLG